MRVYFLPAILAACAMAQPPTYPPPIMQLVRKPGAIAAPLRQYAGSGAAVNVIGMAAITGLSETWLMELHESFASIEDLDKGLSALAQARPAGDPSDPMQDDVLAPSRTMIAAYRADWSYRPDQAIRMFSKARYFFISIYRIRPGMDAEFGDMVRLRRAAFESQNLDRPNLAYQVISGAPGGTVLFVAPMISLRKMDDGVASMPLYAEGFALGRGKEGGKNPAESEVSREHLIFRIDPRLSYVSDAFASPDADFWRGRNRNE